MQTMNVALEPGQRRLSARRTGSAEPLVVQHALLDRRPFLHPLRAPDGCGELTEDCPSHHPWQHGLAIGLNDVNGAGFWTEGLCEPHRSIDGTMHPQPISIVGPDAWEVATEYRSREGTALLEETQRWRIHDSGATYRLDLNWTLRGRDDIHFGRYDYGGLFLRMPWRPGLPAAVLSSEGARELAGCEQQRARWLAVWMPIAGRTNEGGVALFDHPANPQHPLPWRADGNFGIGPSRSSVGAWFCAQGESVRFRHAAHVFTGPGDAAAIEAAYRMFVEETP